jgi:hypothetical protein
MVAIANCNLDNQTTSISNLQVSFAPGKPDFYVFDDLRKNSLPNRFPVRKEFYSRIKAVWD